MGVASRWVLGLLLAGAAACASAPPRLRAISKAPAPAPALPAPVQAALPEPAAPDLFVRCADEASCPSAVGMLIVATDELLEPERCTATLIAPDRILTVCHCLAASARHAGAPCPSTWVSFPRTARGEGEQVACERVEHAAATDESALQQEYAVLKLARAVARAPLAIDATPPAPGSIVTVASVTPHPIYGSTHLLTTRLCRAIDSSLAQTELGASAGNVGWLSSCPIARGNSGSPVLDYELNIRAIVHGGTNLTSAFGVTSVPPQ